MIDPATSDTRPPSERFMVDVHLTAPTTHPDLAHLHSGPLLPAWLTRLVTCDTATRTWITTPDANVNLGRRQRTVNARLRKVVEHRDRGCRIPGCDATRWLTIHHLTHWADGGPSDTNNLVALCPAHHRLLHRGDLVVTGNPDTGTLTITTRDGTPLEPTPPHPPPTTNPKTAAATLNLPTPRWTNRSGERADWHWLTWTPEPTPATNSH